MVRFHSASKQASPGRSDCMQAPPLFFQDYMPRGRAQGLFTQVGFGDPSQDDSSQSHFGVAGQALLQSQVTPDPCSLNVSEETLRRRRRRRRPLTDALLSQGMMNHPLYSQPFTQYSAPPPQPQQSQSQGSPNQKLHYTTS